ncbi:MAG: transketolase [SAR202 cluster bacterium]|nr:transketolase [SAR202 cluster bacterium]|tara:strand:- start:12363 stop:13157 length:795 start_codon:yes stop_codon:yes gene_type:complete
MESLSKELRQDILNTIFEAGSGHPGGSLSAVEILTSLYWKEMQHDPANPGNPDRDKFILSKAHACPVLYVVLAKCGYFPREELWTFRKIGSILQGHAHIMTPGVEMSGGSLGQGLSFGVGSALAARLDSKKSRTYVLLGDGECDEGQIWEAAMSAAHYKLDNLVAIIDRNGIQNDRLTSEVMNLEPLPDKWRSFGWNTIEIDGHKFEDIIASLKTARSTKDKPTAIIATTIKGKGVSFMENNPGFHGKSPNEEELVKALDELSR